MSVIIIDYGMSFNFCIYFSVSYIWSMIWAFQNIPSFIWIAMSFAFLPMVMAVPDDGQFPDVSFTLFSQCVKENFSSRITLSQVLLVLFTITDNHDLLNLHARQQNPRFNGENHSSNSGWLKCLAHAL